MKSQKRKIIFGSAAIKHWYNNFRDPKDIDYINKDYQGSTKMEEHHWVDSYQYLLDSNKDENYLDPELILTCKASHAGWQVHWEKTMVDILFLKSKGHKINKEIYKKLKKDWKKVHGRESAPLLGKNAKTFFEDAVNRKYVHDDIHVAVAYYDRPLFEKTLVDNSGSVMCSEEKFNQLSLDDQIKMAKEEIYVTALERFIIPNDFNYSKGKAYNASLKKFVTTMSSGWMTFFLIDNFKDLMYDGFDYVSLFKQNEHNCKKI